MVLPQTTAAFGYVESPLDVRMRKSDVKTRQDGGMLDRSNPITAAASAA